MPAVTRCAIGIDVGGTSARVGVAAEDGAMLFETSVPTAITTARDELLDRLLGAVEEASRFAARAGLRPEGIGVGMPAFVDDSGCITGSCNLPALNGVAFPRLLESRFGWPVHMENDVSAAAYGEYCFGGYRGASRRLLFVAIGTGIGAGMIVDDRLLRVARGCLGDPGHVIVDASGELPCRCGGNGCLEAAASGWALVERARRLGVEATPREIFESGDAGDSVLSRLAGDAACAVGVGLATLCVLFNPDTIVLGGGVAVEGGEFLRGRAERTLRAHAVPLFSEQVRVVLAKLDRAAGLLGAAAFVLFQDSA